MKPIHSIVMPVELESTSVMPAMIHTLGLLVSSVTVPQLRRVGCQKTVAREQLISDMESPNAAEEKFRRIGMAEFFLRSDTLPVGDILGLLADHLESLWGRQNPVSVTLWQRGYALYLEWWEKLNREHEAALWRIQHDVEWHRERAGRIKVRMRGGVAGEPHHGAGFPEPFTGSASTFTSTISESTRASLPTREAPITNPS